LWEDKDIWSIDLNSQLFPPTPDPMLMRNSLVNTLFLESHYDRIFDLNLINKVQYIRNRQREDEFGDGVSQPDDVVSTFTMVNKVDYTIRAGALRVRPMFKHLLYRRASDNELARRDTLRDPATGETKIVKGEPFESYSLYTPILRVDYSLTPKSSLQLGFQGLPFWRYRRTDRIDDIQSFKQWDVIFMMSSRSDYWGYNAVNQIGYARTSKNFDDESMRTADERNSRIFFDIVVGY